MKNTNLHQAKKAKNDEFYTMVEDVEKELVHYKDFFKGKVVYCNSNDGNKSAFFKYFTEHFKELGLKKLISIEYNKDGNGKAYIVEDDQDEGDKSKG